MASALTASFSEQSVRPALPSFRSASGRVRIPVIRATRRCLFPAARALRRGESATSCCAQSAAAQRPSRSSARRLLRFRFAADLGGVRLAEGVGRICHHRRLRLDRRRNALQRRIDCRNDVVRPGCPAETSQCSGSSGGSAAGSAFLNPCCVAALETDLRAVACARLLAGLRADCIASLSAGCIDLLVAGSSRLVVVFLRG